MTEKNVSSHIRLEDGSKVMSQDKLKQLGLTFGQRPNVNMCIDDLLAKFRKRLWYIRHLRTAGLNKSDLTSMYKCFLLSVVDYASVVYGPMLNADQIHRLEMLQASALRIIYGLKKL